MPGRVGTISPMGRLTSLLRRADTARLATLLLALWKLFRHPQTPWLPKVVAVLVLAYALSPIDLIPDVIPVLGQLDDLVLVPLGIALAVKLTPDELWLFAAMRDAA
ncbi:MAG: YkvA family protein [Burkholderiaceae bacterium]|nr:YkvA family protein [Burkholderiaceae bacterium]